MSKDDIMYLSVLSHKPFMVARAMLPFHLRKNMKIRTREGYSACFHEKDAENKKTNIKIMDDDRIPNDVSDVYWIFAGDEYTLETPWGFRVTNKEGSSIAINGILRVTVTCSYDQLVDIDSLDWEEITDSNGIVYQYLSDHFIDGWGEHKGLSIFFRNEYLPELKKIIDGFLEEAKDFGKLKKLIGDKLEGREWTKEDYWKVEVLSGINVIDVKEDE